MHVCACIKIKYTSIPSMKIPTPVIEHLCLKAQMDD